MALYSSYDQVGKKEDVSDLISNITPTKTPFQSLIGNEKISNTLFQWQEDSLRDVVDNAFVEGFTATDETMTPTVMRQNYSQILAKVFKVSNTADAVSTYGRAKESAYQASKAMAEVKRDLENAFVGTKQVAAAGSSSVARKMAGAQAQIDAANKVKTGGASTAMTEANLLTALQKLYDAGAEPAYIMVTPTDAQTVAGFANASGRTREISNGSQDRAIVNAIDLYVSPYGEVRVILNRFLAAGDAIVFDPEMWKQCTLRSWFRETYAKTGDNVLMGVVGEFSLKHKNAKGSALIRREA